MYRTMLDKYQFVKEGKHLMYEGQSSIDYVKCEHYKKPSGYLMFRDVD